MNNNIIKINKYKVYYKNQHKLNKQFIQFKIYFIINLILYLSKILFMLIIFKNKLKNILTIIKKNSILDVLKLKFYKYLKY